MTDYLQAREQAVEVMAEAIMAILGGIKDEPSRRATARTCATDALLALLAARVPCPTCGGRGYVMVTLTGRQFDERMKDCPDCDNGRGGPPVLLGAEQIGTADRKDPLCT